MHGFPPHAIPAPCHIRPIPHPLHATAPSQNVSNLGKLISDVKLDVYDFSEQGADQVQMTNCVHGWVEGGAMCHYIVFMGGLRVVLCVTTLCVYMRNIYKQRQSWHVIATPIMAHPFVSVSRLSV